MIHEVEAKLGSSVDEAQKRFFAIKLLEKDDKIPAQMKSVPDVSAEIKQLEAAMDDDTESIITNERYTYISSIIKECYTKKEGQKLTTSDKIDKIITTAKIGSASHLLVTIRSILSDVESLSFLALVTH